MSKRSITKNTEKTTKPSRKKISLWIAGGLLAVGAICAAVVYLVVALGLSDGDIVSKAKLAVQTIDRYDVKADMLIKGNKGGSSLGSRETVLKLDYELAYDKNTEAFHLNYKANAPSLNDMRSAEIYLVDGKAYSKLEGSASWKAVNYSDHSRAFMKDVDTASLMGATLLRDYGDKVEKIDRSGNDYVLHFANDKDTVRSIIGTAATNQIAVHDSSTDAARSQNNDFTINNATITVTVDKKTFALKSMLIDISYRGVGDRSRVTYVTKQDITYRSINNELGITVPEEAK